MNRKGLFVLGFTLLAMLSIGSSSQAQLAPDADPATPTNISCQGWERDSVLIYWKDNATDENNYRVERSIDGSAWSEISTVNPDANGNYPGYKDTSTDTTKNYRYRVRAYRTSDTTYSAYSSICDNRRIYEPGNFRIFYGLRGTSDDCPLIDGREVCLTNLSTGGVNNYVDLQYDSLQGSADAYARLGFLLRADTPTGGLDKIPINVVWCDGGGCAGGGGIGLSPLLMETAFNVTTRVGDPVAYIVPLHESFHFLQFKYWGLSDPSDNWVVEGQARSIQDKICIGSSRPTALCFDDIATGYAGYVPELMGYLSNPNRPIVETSYQAALFWTYLTEKFGTENLSDQAEIGMDFMRRFWENSAATPGRDGITVINSVLTALGRTERFRDIWKDFAVANYAKNFTAAAEYTYADMAQTGGTYGGVALSLDEALSLNESYLDTDESVYNWGAKYYQLRPDSNVPFIDIKITQDTPNNLYYTVLGIQGTSVVYEYNLEARNLNLPLLNDSYDKVAIVVAGLENLGNYRIAINGTQPSLRILSPTSSTKARVGSTTAPDKFLVQLEVVDGSGLPMVGVNLASFSFRVGTVDVPAANVLTSAALMGQQWFVLRAPAQSTTDPDGTPNTYELQAQYGSALTDSEDDAVDYTPRLNADSMILLDRSGSMSWYNKLYNAGNAAKLFVDSWRTGDQIGLITFASDPTVDLGLTPWTETPDGGSRQDAIDIINGLVAVGGTRIGDTLIAGYNNLLADGNTSHDWALVLLSDGDETDPGVRTFDQAISDIANASGKKPVIHTVAVGPDADRVRMQRAATSTGGTYQYVSAPAKVVTQDQVFDISSMGLSMDYRYRAIATEILGHQQFFTFVGPYYDDTPGYDDVSITVEAGAAELVISLSWDGYMGYVHLYDPYENEEFYFQEDWRHMVWRISNPVGGTWHLVVNEYYIPLGAEANPDAPADLPPYLVQASIKTDVTMQAYLTTPVAERVPGHPMQIVASLTDNSPILDAWVLAGVEQPSGGLIYVWLWDDGLHDDGAADDGIYGGTFYQTGQGGSYNVTVMAWGYSPSLDENFYRSQTLSFHMALVDVNGNEIDDTDIDGDGLWDGWEIFWYGDPYAWGPFDDPDNDGSNNQDEEDQGTDPFDPDTDDDGESDGTDPNPLDPDVDPIPVPWAQAYAGDGQVFIKYSIDPDYLYLGVFRDEDDDMDMIYTFLDQHIAPLGGVFTDTLVTNDHQYCYVVAAVDTDLRRSTTSAPTCAVPRGDPYPPHGAVLINGGAPSTALPDVTLTLWASDEVDPEGEYPGGDRFLPSADSASGVVEMLISNNMDFSGASWEAYNTSKPWTLAQTYGLAAVYVKYRDLAGNETDTIVTTIYVGSSNPNTIPMFIPMVAK